MTILEVKNQLVSHFLKYDTFDPVKHAFEVNFDKETANFREQIVRAALADLEGSGFIKRFDNEDKSLWVLAQPIGTYSQQITISPIIADMMAAVVNFHNDIDEIDYIVDKTKIDEGVIARLLNIISEYDDAMMENEQGGTSQDSDEEERE